jgi:hypothetical protein
MPRLVVHSNNVAFVISRVEEPTLSPDSPQHKLLSVKCEEYSRINFPMGYVLMIDIVVIINSIQFAAEINRFPFRKRFAIS